MNSRSEDAAAPTTSSSEPFLAGHEEERAALLQARHENPHGFLGPHLLELGGEPGTVVRAFHPEARSIHLLLEGGDEHRMHDLGGGLFAVWIAEGTKGRGGENPFPPYRQKLRFEKGDEWIRDDPYRFPPTLDDFQLYLLSEGNHLQLWESLGCRPMEIDGVEGFAFSVWAPNAQRVSVVGDFCFWDGRLFPMRRLGVSGIFDLFLPGLPDETLYKFEILGADGSRFLKADPVARFAEVPPGTASRCYRSTYEWADSEWMSKVPERDVTREPMAIYEVHLGSWLRGAEPRADKSSGTRSESLRDRDLTYRELAPRLVEHVQKLGFNYLELLPVAEHPYSGSWGYQITGYFAPTARHGEPDDFRFFVDYCHQQGIGVILDWVPAHFVKDAHGLGRFDGSALYEHQDPRLGSHPDWGTYIFNYGRWEVRNFLVANALYWLDQFHVDGLRIDAVASMLYLDYSREEGQWLPNAHGGRENLEAIALLRAVNQTIAERYPGHFTVAEESTAWPGITKPVAEGGLGFTFKWNMGWMHDTLSYFEVDPLFRGGCHDKLTFAMVYEYSERFLNPLSHDEVVHGKGSLYGKMPGDPWQKLANLRALFAYQLTRPGKKLLFMGSELASSREWNHETSLDWYLLGDPARKGIFQLLQELGTLYQEHRCLWEGDPDPESFTWISCQDHAASVLAYERRSGGIDLPTSAASAEDGDTAFEPLRRYAHRLVVVLNLTPVPRRDYRLGALEPGAYRCLLSSDEERFGGSGFPFHERVETEPVAADSCHQSLVLDLPPLSALILEPEPQKKAKRTTRKKKTARPRSARNTTDSP